MGFEKLLTSVLLGKVKDLDNFLVARAELVKELNQRAFDGDPEAKSFMTMEDNRNANE